MSDNPSPVIIILDPSTGNLVGSKDEGNDIISLNTNIRSGIVQVNLGVNTKYENLVPDQSLTNGQFDEIYLENTDTGKIILARFVFNNNDIDIKVTIDGQTTSMINNFNLYDLYKEHELEDDSKLISVKNQGKILLFQYENGLSYSTSFKIEAKANRNNIIMKRGLVIRSVE